MYQPSIECEYCPNTIHADDPLFIYKICAKCVIQCEVCNEIINDSEVVQHNHYLCYKHTVEIGGRIQCILCSHNTMNCYNCDKLTSVRTMACLAAEFFPNIINNNNDNFIYVCNDCDIQCIYCDNMAISEKQLCAKHALRRKFTKKDIIHPDTNRFYVDKITAILLVLRRRRVPRPLQIVIIRLNYAISN